jgi:hypothetical protein
MTGIKDWSTTAGNNTDAVPNGAPEGWAPSEVNSWGRTTMAEVKGFRDTMEWRDWGHTITFVSATSFSTGASNDTTGIYLAGRRVRCVGSSTGTIYGTVASSSGTNPTTVVVDWDSSELVSEAGIIASLGLDPTGNAWSKTTQDNYLINPDFHFWQRGTSFTASEYTADRWYLSLGTGAAATLTQATFTLGQTDVPEDPRYYVNIDRTTAGTTGTGFGQRIEDVRPTSGKTFTVSFWAKCTSGTFDLGLKLVQDFGLTGDADVQLTTQDNTLTTTWTKFTNTFVFASISGKTISGSGSHWRVRFSWDETEGPTSEIQLALCKVEEGAYATPFLRRPWGQEMALCQRYYEQSFNFVTTPATQVAAYPLRYTTGVSGVVNSEATWYFQTRKRTTPTITTYNPVSDNANFYNNTGAADSGVPSVATAAPHSVSIVNPQLSGDSAGQVMMIHATADAEITS